jgi:hypothetical protein
MPAHLNENGGMCQTLAVLNISGAALSISMNGSKPILNDGVETSGPPNRESSKYEKYV